MTVKYFNIDQGIIRSLIRARKLSNVQIAKRLNVSTKTIQRWTNGTVLRIRAEVLNDLAEILSTTPAELIVKDQDTVRVKPANKLVKSITTDDYFLHVRATEDWHNYIETLQSIALEELPNLQEIKVIKCLGAAYLYLGILHSAKEHLDKARMKALNFKKHEVLIEIYAWFAFYEEMKGGMQECFRWIEDAEKLVGDETSERSRGLLDFFKGTLLLSADRLSEAEPVLRRALRRAHNKGHSDGVRVAIVYPYLGWLYLRQRRFAKARAVFARSLEFAIRAGWPKGVAISKMALAIVEGILLNQTGVPARTLGKAKRYYELTPFRALESRFEQLQFFYGVAIGDFDHAAKYLAERKRLARSIPLRSAHLTLDSLFLAKLQSKNLSEESVEQARLAFQKNGLHAAIEILNWLQSVSKIECEDFLGKYRFY